MGEPSRRGNRRYKSSDEGKHCRERRLFAKDAKPIRRKQQSAEGFALKYSFALSSDFVKVGFKCIDICRIRSGGISKRSRGLSLNGQ